MIWETDAAGGGVTWKTVPGTQSFKADIGSSGEGVGVNQKGSLGEGSAGRTGGRQWCGRNLLRRRISCLARI